MPTAPPSEPGHLLIIRAARLGDTLFTTPAVHALRRRYPDARLTFLTNRYSAPLLAGNPDIDQVLTLEPKSWWARRLGVRRLARRLRNEGVDLVVPLRDRPIWRQLAGLLPGAHLFHQPARQLGSKHLAGRHLEFVQPLLGADPLENPPGLQFRPTASQQAEAAARLAPLGPPLPGSCYAFQPCYFGARPGRQETRRNNRAWPLEHFRALGRRLVAEGARVLVLGAGVGERRVCRELAESIGPGAESLHGLSIGGLGALLAAGGPVKAMVTGDTGPLHLAVAVGLPVVALYGPSDPERSAPWQAARAVVLRRDLWCSPCKGSYLRCYDNVCLQGLSPDDVHRALQQVEAEGPEPPGGPWFITCA